MILITVANPLMMQADVSRSAPQVRRLSVQLVKHVSLTLLVPIFIQKHFSVELHLRTRILVQCHVKTECALTAAVALPILRVLVTSLPFQNPSLRHQRASQFPNQVKWRWPSQLMRLNQKRRLTSRLFLPSLTIAV